SYTTPGALLWLLMMVTSEYHALACDGSAASRSGSMARQLNSELGTVESDLAWENSPDTLRLSVKFHSPPMALLKESVERNELQVYGMSKRLHFIGMIFSAPHSS